MVAWLQLRPGAGRLHPWKPAAPVGDRHDCAWRETMLALRKPAAEPGLRLDEVPVPEPAPTRCWSRSRPRASAAPTCTSTAGTSGRRAGSCRRSRSATSSRGRSSRPARSCANVARRRLRLGREPHHLRRLLPVPHGPRAHVRAHAHPRRRPRRRVRALRRRARVGDLAERPDEAAAGDRHAAGAVRQRGLRDLASRISPAGRSRCSAAGRSGSSRSGSRSASGAATVVASDRTPFRLGLAEKMGASATRQRRRDAPTPRRGSSSQNEGLGFDVVFEMSGSPRAIADAFRIARNGGRVILFGIPSRPVEIDVAEALIFKNLNVLALNGRKIFETWYRTRWLLETRRRRRPAADHQGAAARGVRGGVRAARRGRGLQDRRLPRRRARPAAAAEPRCASTCRLEGRWQHSMRAR